MEFWGTVVAAHSLVPTIVEQCVNFEDRLECGKALAEKVDEALEEAKDCDLESDFDNSNNWHDQYEYLPDECRDYEEIFSEDDPIDNWEDVEATLENYPRIEQEPDYEHVPRSSSSSSSFDDVRAIFSDL